VRCVLVDDSSEKPDDLQCFIMFVLKIVFFFASCWVQFCRNPRYSFNPRTLACVPCVKPEKKKETIIHVLTCTFGWRGLHVLRESEWVDFGARNKKPWFGLEPFTDYNDSLIISCLSCRGLTCWRDHIARKQREHVCRTAACPHSTKHWPKLVCACGTGC